MESTNNANEFTGDLNASAGEPTPTPIQLDSLPDQTIMNDAYAVLINPSLSYNNFDRMTNLFTRAIAVMRFGNSTNIVSGIWSRTADSYYKGYSVNTRFDISSGIAMSQFGWLNFAMIGVGWSFSHSTTKNRDEYGGNYKYGLAVHDGVYKGRLIVNLFLEASIQFANYRKDIKNLYHVDPDDAAKTAINKNNLERKLGTPLGLYNAQQAKIRNVVSIVSGFAFVGTAILGAAFEHANLTGLEGTIEDIKAKIDDPNTTPEEEAELRKLLSTVEAKKERSELTYNAIIWNGVCNFSKALGFTLTEIGRNPVKISGYLAGKYADALLDDLIRANDVKIVDRMSTNINRAHLVANQTIEFQRNRVRVDAYKTYITARLASQPVPNNFSIEIEGRLLGGRIIDGNNVALPGNYNPTVRQIDMALQDIVNDYRGNLHNPRLPNNRVVTNTLILNNIIVDDAYLKHVAPGIERQVLANKIRGYAAEYLSNNQRFNRIYNPISLDKFIENKLKVDAKNQRYLNTPVDAGIPKPAAMKGFSWHGLALGLQIFGTIAGVVAVGYSMHSLAVMKREDLDEDTKKALDAEIAVQVTSGVVGILSNIALIYAMLRPVSVLAQTLPVIGILVSMLLIAVSPLQIRAIQAKEDFIGELKGVAETSEGHGYDGDSLLVDAYEAQVAYEKASLATNIVTSAAGGVLIVLSALAITGIGAPVAIVAGLLLGAVAAAVSGLQDLDNQRVADNNRDMIEEYVDSNGKTGAMPYFANDLLSQYEQTITSDSAIEYIQGLSGWSTENSKVTTSSVLAITTIAMSQTARMLVGQTDFEEEVQQNKVFMERFSVNKDGDVYSNGTDATMSLDETAGVIYTGGATDTGSKQVVVFTTPLLRNGTEEKITKADGNGKNSDLTTLRMSSTNQWTIEESARPGATNQINDYQTTIDLSNIIYFADNPDLNEDSLLVIELNLYGNNDVVHMGAVTTIITQNTVGSGGTTVSYANLENSITVTYDAGTALNAEVVKNLKDNKVLKEIITSEDVSWGKYSDKIEFRTTEEIVITDDVFVTDELNNISTVIGTRFADIMNGNLANNILIGGGGNDVINGGGGNDVIIKNAEISITENDVDTDFQLFELSLEDIITGGDGVDTIDYGNFIVNSTESIHATKSYGVVVDLNFSTQKMYAQKNNVIKISQHEVYGVENVNGSVYSDNLVGNQFDNVLYGDAGDDVIDGSAGNDTLMGGAGNDVIDGGEGNDYISGGLGSNILRGGNGDDTFLILDALDSSEIDGGSGSNALSYSNMTHIDSQSQRELMVSVDVDLINGIAKSYIDHEFMATQVYVNIQNIIGGSGDDTIVGDGVENYLNGGAGNDTLRGGIGNDSVHGDSGFDYLYGDEGDDHLTGGAGSDTLEGGVGDDLLSGGDGFDTIYGGDGNDFISGGNDFNSLYGGKGDDIFEVDFNKEVGDYLDGEEGVNTLKYFTSDALIEDRTFANNFTGITVELGTSFSGGIGQVELPAVMYTDEILESGERQSINLAYSIRNIDNVVATPFSDTLRGNENVNKLIGGHGNDIINGMAGDDLLVGDTGNDEISGGLGDDVILGGEGSDHLNGNEGTDVFFQNDALDADSIDGGIGDDVVNYEYMVGSAIVVDFTGDAALITKSPVGSLKPTKDLIKNVESYVGTNLSDRFNGAAGDYSFYGMGGNDTITGGSGSETLFGGDGDDSINAGAGNDVIMGGLGRDTIDAGTGDDRILADFDSVDSIHGGDGSDFISYENANISAQYILINFFNAVPDGLVTLALTIDGISHEYQINSLSNDGKSVQINLGNVFVIDSIGLISNLPLEHNHQIYLGKSDLTQLTASQLTPESGIVVLSGSKNYLFNGVTVNLASTIVTHTLLNPVNSYDGSVVPNRFISPINPIAYLDSIEAVEGTVYSDTFIGNGDDNVFNGGRGSDTIFADAGNDYIIQDISGIYKEDHDTLDGGDGEDTVSYANSQIVTRYIAVQSVTHFAQEGATQSITVQINAESAIKLEGTVVNNRVQFDLGDYYSLENLSILMENVPGYYQVFFSVNNMSQASSSDLVHADGVFVAYEAIAANEKVHQFQSLSGIDADLSTGVVKKFNDFFVNDKVVNIENIVGTYVADTIVGNDFSNTLDGGSGNDTIAGGVGDDILIGGEGADKLYGGAGDDQLFGGQLSSGVVSTGGDVIDGGDGDDIVYQSMQNSLSDDINGGDGLDTIDYSYSNNPGISADANIVGISANLKQGTVRRFASPYTTDLTTTTDKVSNIENVVGTSFTDFLTGDDASNQLTGGLGADVIFANGGDDVIHQHLQQNIQDYIDGGDGSDTVNYGVTDLSGVAYGSDGISVDLNDLDRNGAAAVYKLGSDSDFDLIVSVENIVATHLADTLIGNSADNIVVAGLGADTVEGGSGDDTVYEYLQVLEKNVIDGGEGSDLLDYSMSDMSIYQGTAVTRGIDVDLMGSNHNGQQSVYKLGSTSDVDLIKGIEHISATDLNDVLLGDESDNQLQGVGGDDVLVGRAGNDVLAGGAGTDVVDGGDGDDTIVQMLQAGVSDTIDGGDGIDTLVYSQVDPSVSSTAATRGIALYLNQVDTDGYVRVYQLGSPTHFDRVRSIEHVVGSEFSDTVEGDDADNQLMGMAGNDTLKGGAGNDVLIGGIGADTLEGGAGDDVIAQHLQLGVIDQIDGGQGVDTLDYSMTNFEGVDTDQFAYGINVNLSEIDTKVYKLGATGDFDRISGIENVVGSSLADTLVGDAQDNRLTGLDGDDVLNGGAGRDVLWGGNGADALNGGEGDDTIVITLDDGMVDTIDGGSGADTLNLSLATIEGGVALSFGLDDGFMYAYESGVVSDEDYSAVHSEVAAALGGEQAQEDYDAYNAMYHQKFLQLLQSKGQGYVRFRGIENVIGTKDDDYFIGGDQDNQLMGMNGDDGLEGKGGDDILMGGLGEDQLYGGAGSDVLIGGLGQDDLYGDAGDDTTIQDVLQAGVHDYITGGDGVDTLDYHYADLALGLVSEDFDQAPPVSSQLGSLIAGAPQGVDDRLLLGGNGGETAPFWKQSVTLTDGVVYRFVGMVAALGSGATRIGVLVDGVLVKEFDTTLWGDKEWKEISVELNAAGSAEFELALIDLSQTSTVDHHFAIDHLRLLPAKGIEVDMQEAAGEGEFSGDSAKVYRFGTTTQFDQIESIENIIATELADVLKGNDQDNQLLGLGGKDSLMGRDGNDTLVGGWGADIIDGGSGDDMIVQDLQAGVRDTIDGGEGNDVLDYSQADVSAINFATAPYGITVDLALVESGTTQVYKFGSTSDVDVIKGIEHIIATDLTDALKGDAGDNQLLGMGGDDVLVGRAGDDLLAGGAGTDVVDGGDGDDTIVQMLQAGVSDTIDGGDGIDTLDYSQVDQSVYSTGMTHGIALHLNQVDANGDAKVYKLGSTTDFDRVRGIEQVVGSELADTVEGDDAANQLMGMAGNDTLKGGAGDDVLIGGIGADTLEGGAGDDVIAQHLQLGVSDQIDGGQGVDTLDYSMTNFEGVDTDQFAYGINVNLSEIDEAGTAKVYKLGSTRDTTSDFDRISGIENVVGSLLADTMVGDAQDNRLMGLDGNDVLTGGAGSDVLWGGLGADELNGGEGDDTIVITFDDWMVDTIDGGSGADTLNFSFATMQGGGGLSFGLDDGFVYAYESGMVSDEEAYAIVAEVAAARGVTAESVLEDDSALLLLNAKLFDLLKSKGQGYLRFAGIENVMGTQGDDRFIGSDQDNQLMGMYGDDALEGKGGDDVLMGGLGADEVYGGDGDDTVIQELQQDVSDFIDGGAGNDVLDYSYADLSQLDTTSISKGIAVDLNAVDEDGAARVWKLGATEMDEGSNAADRIVGIEHITATQLDDVLKGDANANRLVGMAGDDELDGGAGNDVLVGGDGIDALYGQEGDDHLYQDTRRSGWSDVNDLFDGGDGVDTLDYSLLDTSDLESDANGVHINLGTGEVVKWLGRQSVSDYDSVLNIENVIGTSLVDRIFGDANANQLIGLDGGDSLIGGLGDDVLVGGVGWDRVYGGDGNDLIVQTLRLDSTDSDMLFGGDGTDTIDYSSLDMSDAALSGITEGISVDLSQGNTLFLTVYQNDGSLQNVSQSFSRVYRFGSTQVFDEITEIENIIGTSLSDTMIGDSQNNHLVAWDGNDFLQGGEGNDVLVGGMGADTLEGGDGADTVVQTLDVDSIDTIDGGDGVDTLDYSQIDFSGLDVSEMPQGLYVALGDESTQGRVDVQLVGASHQVASVTGVENVSGTSLNDLLVGNSHNNLLLGQEGDDTLSAGQGDDVLAGGSGADTLDGGDGNDLIAQEMQVRVSDTIDGGTGRDTVDYSATDLSYLEGSQITQGIEIHLSELDELGYVKAYKFGLSAEFDLLKGIENLAGTQLIDTLIGDDSDNQLMGLEGDDVLQGGGGNDVLIGGMGADYVSAGAGDDVIVQELQLGNSDTLDGGDGIDTLNYSRADLSDHEATESSQGIQLDLSQVDDNGYARVYKLGSTTEFDRAAGIDNVNGSALSDVITGDANDNQLIGWGGDDVLQGGAGNDVLVGGDGIDALYGQEGDDHLYQDVWSYVNDVFDGGDGVDTIDCSLLDTSDLESDANGVYITLGMGGIINIENAIGTSVEDRIFGDANANQLIGLDGGDSLIGGLGDDVLVGGVGWDRVYGGDGNDFIVQTLQFDSTDSDMLYGGDGADTIDYSSLDMSDAALSGITEGISVDLSQGDTRFVTEYQNDGSLQNTYRFWSTVYRFGSTQVFDEITEIENIIGTDLNDTFVGNASGNALIGLGGDDHFFSGAYDAQDDYNWWGDFIDGGDGVDTLNYSQLQVQYGVEVNLTSGTAKKFSIYGPTDTIEGIENLVGTDQNDVLVGDANDNRIEGGWGADRMQGGAGNDTIVVQLEEDASNTIVGGQGVDTVDYSHSYVGDDQWSPSQGIHLDLSATDSYTQSRAYKWGGLTDFDTVQGIENIIGTQWSDVLVGDANANVLNGGAGNDTLEGGNGSDTYLFARGDGVDTIIESNDPAGSIDQLVFLDGITQDQLWLTQNTWDLDISIIGTQDSVRIHNWYLAPSNQIEEIKLSDGSTLSRTDVNQLVQAMAQFDPVGAGASHLSADYKAALTPAIVAAWH